MTKAEIRKKYHYNPKTGIFTNKKTGHSPKPPTGRWCYIRISFSNRTMALHRLAFLYMTGKIPKLVDHINRNRLDNRWCNLREADPALNLVNGMRKNKTGYKGVTKNRTAGYTAKTKVNQKTIRIGSSYPTAKAAHLAYRAFTYKRFGRKVCVESL